MPIYFRRFCKSSIRSPHEEKFWRATIAVANFLGSFFLDYPTIGGKMSMFDPKKECISWENLRWTWFMELVIPKIYRREILSF